MVMSKTPDVFYLMVTLVILMFICIKTRKLTIPASFLAAAIGIMVFQAAQWTGIWMLLAFFMLSVLATAHQKNIKTKLHRDNLANKARNTGQVFANGGVAGLTAILAIIYPRHADPYILMMAASLASALADTLSSELGMVYGRNFYNILTFKKETNGLDGVISLQGVLIGAAGACIIAFIYAGFNKIGLIVVFAGILGNLADSVLGAAFERKHYIGNNAVNFLNTLFAAATAMIIYLFR
ncbi:DUF92 domain-containing protein [Pedobacter heparinus]|uniref:DUF92 domain-containing protein n=1 Tax=Pedobacter heparinus TaxID=984 RepID=UPI00292ED9E8|nr:DUF92 domain-containing protein [Pedobacter heparinus]